MWYFAHIFQKAQMTWNKRVHILAKFFMPFQVQSTLGFTTRGLAVDLALATGWAVTDLRQYINSDLVFSDLKFGPLCSEIVTVKVVLPNGLKPICF